MHIAHLKGPPKTYLKSVLLAAATVFTMYLLGSLAISVVVIVTPRLQLHLMERSVAELRAAIDRVAPGEIIQVTISQ